MIKTTAVGPDIIPFARPRPDPLLRVWKTYIVGGRRVRLFGERWRVEDTRHLAFPCHPDPHSPGVVYSWRLFDLETGALIAPLADVAVSESRWPRHPHPGA